MQSYKEVPVETLKQIKDSLQIRGIGLYGKNLKIPTYDAMKLFDLSIRLGAMVWESILDKQGEKISKNQFVKSVWTFLTTEPYKYSDDVLPKEDIVGFGIYSSPLHQFSYLQGLTKANLKKLFDLYFPHKNEENAMSIIELIHCFTYLLRPDLIGEMGELSLASTIDRIHFAIQTCPALLKALLKSPLCLSRPEAVKQLETKDYALYMPEARTNTYFGTKTSWGLNLVLTCKDKEGKIGHLPLLCVKTPDHLWPDLSSLPQLVEALKTLEIYNPYSKPYLSKLSMPESKNEPRFSDPKILATLLNDTLTESSIQLAKGIIDFIVNYLGHHLYHVSELKEIPDAFSIGEFCRFDDFLPFTEFKAIRKARPLEIQACTLTQPKISTTENAFTLMQPTDSITGNNPLALMKPTGNVTGMTNICLLPPSNASRQVQGCPFDFGNNIPPHLLPAKNTSPKTDRAQKTSSPDLDVSDFPVFKSPWDMKTDGNNASQSPTTPSRSSGMPFSFTQNNACFMPQATQTIDVNASNNKPKTTTEKKAQKTAGFNLNLSLFTPNTCQNAVQGSNNNNQTNQPK